MPGAERRAASIAAERVTEAGRGVCRPRSSLVSSSEVCLPSTFALSWLSRPLSSAKAAAVAVPPPMSTAAVTAAMAILCFMRVPPDVGCPCAT